MTTRRPPAASRQPRLRVLARRRSPRPHLIAAGCFTLVLLALAAIARAEPETRTLDAVTIEGEVRLPEVLFITSRDVARPLDWLDHYAGPSAEALAPRLPLPLEVHVPRVDAVPNPEPEAGDPSRSSEPRSTEEEIR
ncbi:MAG TPA: hypothetical protein VKU85_11020 [bacterium]|nr:hypothetical protein [bacterium]